MGARQNVLLVANYRPDAGYAWWLIEGFWLQIEQAVADRGGRCLLIYPRPGPIPPEIARSSIEVWVHDFSDSSLRGLAHLRQLLRSRNIGSAYLTDRHYLDWRYALMRLWGIERIVLQDHTPGERPKPSLVRLLAKRLLHGFRLFSCDLYIGVSRFVARRLLEVGGVPRRRITYVHNGITAPRDVMHDNRIRDLLGVGSEGVLVVNVGRAHRYKGIDFMVDVAAELRRRGRQGIAFTHVGDGPHLAEFKQRARDCNVQDHFHFAGERHDVQSILRAADIAFHTSHGEAFSLAVIEYMAAGLAVLVPNHCGNGEAVEDGVDGLLYEPGNLEEAVAKLLELADRPEWREQLGQAAREKVLREFRLEDCHRQFREVIEAVLFGRGKNAAYHVRWNGGRLA